MSGVCLWHKLLGAWEAGQWATAYQYFLQQSPETAATPMTFLGMVPVEGLQETINSCEQIVLERQENVLQATCNYCVVSKHGLCRIENLHAPFRQLLLNGPLGWVNLLGWEKCSGQRTVSSLGFDEFCILEQMYLFSHHISWSLQALNSRETPVSWPVSSLPLPYKRIFLLKLWPYCSLQCENKLKEKSTFRDFGDGDSIGCCPGVTAQGMVEALNQLKQQECQC